MKPYVFGHRGAMGYEIENTLPSFKKAVEMKAGIETDLHLTKDNILVCFHDHGFQIGAQSYMINQLTLKELRNIRFEDEREVPTFEDIVRIFKDSPKTPRFSCDIGNKKVGLELINFIEKFSLFERLEITDLKPRVLFNLRKKNDKVQLVHTVPFIVVHINNKTIKFDKIHENQISILNIKYDRVSEENFKNIIDNGFKCYCWGVNSKARMKKVLNMKYKDETFSAIYTNFPDILINLRDEIYS